MMIIHDGKSITAEEISDLSFKAIIRLKDGSEIEVDESDLSSLKELWNYKHPKQELPSGKRNKTFAETRYSRR